MVKFATAIFPLKVVPPDCVTVTVPVSEIAPTDTTPELPPALRVRSAFVALAASSPSNPKRLMSPVPPLVTKITSCPLLLSLAVIAPMFLLIAMSPLLAVRVMLPPLVFVSSTTLAKLSNVNDVPAVISTSTSKVSPPAAPLPVISMEPAVMV